MARELSSGFDVAAVLSEAAVHRMFQVGYHAGLLPTRATTTFAHEGDDHELVLTFLPPSLQFVSVPGEENAVQVRFPFVAQVPTLNAQGAAAVAVFLTAVKDSAFDAENVEFEFVALDFSVVPESQYRIEEEPLPPLPPAAAAAFGVLPEWIVNDVAATLAKDVLRAGIDRLPITPRVASGFAFFTFRTYVDDSFTLPPHGVPYVLPRTLGAYANLAEVDREAPDVAPLPLWQRADHFGPHAGMQWTEQDDMRIAIPVELVEERIRAARVDQGLDELPAPLPDDATVVLNALDVSLGQGRVIVSGNATKIVEDGPDPDVDFRLELVLAIEGGKLQSIVVDQEFDLPWWADALPVVLPVVGAMILHSIRVRMAGETGSIGGLAGGLVADANPFADSFPGAALAQVTIDNDGPIDVSPLGIVLHGRLRSTLDPSGVPRPRYVYGHRFTREFHVDDADCPYQAKLKPQNTILFLSAAAALAQGWNGCRVCCPAYDSDASGRLLLHYRSLDPPSPPPSSIAVSVELRRLDPLDAEGQTVVPEARFDRTLTTHVGEDGALYFQDMGLPDLLPGAWSLEVATGTWSTEVDVVIARWGRYSGKNTHVTFTTGHDGAHAAFRKKPSYP